MKKKMENETERDKSHLTAASVQQKSINFRTVDNEDDSHAHKHAQLHATTWIVDNAFCVVPFGCFWRADYGGGAATVTNCVVTRVRSNLSIFFSFLKNVKAFGAVIILISTVRDTVPLLIQTKDVRIWGVSTFTTLTWHYQLKWNCRKEKSKISNEFRSSGWVCSNTNFLRRTKNNSLSSLSDVRAYCASVCRQPIVDCDPAHHRMWKSKIDTTCMYWWTIMVAVAAAPRWHQQPRIWMAASDSL